MNLLPYPRSLKRFPGTCTLPSRATLFLDESLSLGVSKLVVKRLRDAGLKLERRSPTWRVLKGAFHGAEPESGAPLPPIRIIRTNSAPAHGEGYTLTIERGGVLIEYREVGGLRAAVATLRQLLREYGRRLPCQVIRDYPDFARRGVMLDISRGRVPNLQTLLGLVDHLADFKINEFQLYTEHTFAYRNYKPVWRDWGALTATEIRQLDTRCRELGIDLVPNQNSFGHLRYWLEYPPLRKLAEISKPYEGATGDFLRFPATLAPNHPGTLKFIRELYDELLPNFFSRYFNVGCDETWDLGRGQSKGPCERKGKGRVYLDFLKKIHREVRKRGRQMMFWGDIILHHPELIPDLPKDVIALTWGYEADHPFDEETAVFEKSRVPFYVCPGTSTWMSLIGRHDTGFANLRLAAEAGREHGALGYLNTDWGDGGHPQPLAVSYAPYLLGASVSWCAASFEEQLLVPVLSRDVFQDPTGRVANAAIALGFAHRKFGYREANVTPFGAVIAAPPPETRELFCRSGLKYYARITEKNVRAALTEVEQQRAVLRSAKPSTTAAGVLRTELDLAARMAAQSCKIMLWQNALASSRSSVARRLARSGVTALRELEREFKACWPLRNKGTHVKCTPFLQWRINDYRHGKLHFPPEIARVAQTKTHAAE